MTRGEGGSWPRPGDPVARTPASYLSRVAEQAAAERPGPRSHPPRRPAHRHRRPRRSRSRRPDSRPQWPRRDADNTSPGKVFPARTGASSLTSSSVSVAGEPVSSPRPATVPRECALPGTHPTARPPTIAGRPSAVPRHPPAQGRRPARHAVSSPYDPASDRGVASCCVYRHPPRPWVPAARLPGTRRGVCWGARCGTCLAPRLVR